MSETAAEPFPIVEWLDRRTRTQRLAIVVIAALYVLWRIVGWAASQQLDRWWYDALTDAPIWRERLEAQVLVVFTATAVSLLLMFVSNRFALRVTAPAGQPTFRPIAVVHDRLGPAKRWIALALPVLFTLYIARASGDYWTQWLLFRNSRNLGVEAPQVGFDLSYHLFRLPLLSTVTAWLMSLIAVTFVMAAVIYVLDGCLRLPIGGRRSSARAVRHLAALGAAWLGVRAVEYWFVDYPRLASIGGGRFDGAGYAQMHGPGVAYRPLGLLALAAAVALTLFAFGRLRFRWSGAMITTLILLHVALVLGAPIAFQRFVVDPAEAERELPYLDANLSQTRDAYDLDRAEVSTVSLSDGIDVPTDLKRLPLFNTDQLAPALQVLQGIRGTKINDVDLDRYAFDDDEGRLEPVYVATRDAALGELPERGWVQDHLVYTHGDGMVASRADQTTAAGILEFNDLDAQLGLLETDLYYGQNLAGWYVVTGTERDQSTTSDAAARTGIPLGSTWRRAVAATALGDYNLFASGELGSDASLLTQRSAVGRVHRLAPFLTLDSDPHPVISDGRIVWVVDGYTTSATFPYSEQANVSGVPDGSGLTGRTANYVRHAVIATVDGLDGTTHIYTDDRAATASDPVLDIWRRTFPGLIEPFDDIPDDLSAHLDYGSDFFTVQTNMLGRYHVDDAETLFSGTDAWLIAPTPGDSVDEPGSGPSRAVNMFANEDATAPWTALRSFVPGAVGNPSSARAELAAFAIADHTSGELSIVRLESADGRQLTSPKVAQSLIAADPRVSELLTLLNSNGTTVAFGPMTPMMSDGQLAWLRSLIVVGASETATPRVHSVLAVSNGQVGIGSNPSEALAATLDGRAD